MGRRLMHRDRLGITPLLYAPSSKGVITGRSYREIFTTGAIKKSWRREALKDFLTTGTVVFRDQETFFDGVFKVPPGYGLRIEGNKATVTPGEKIPEATEELGEEALPILREMLIEAFKGNLKNAALSLSGGLDSNSLAAAWSKNGAPRCFIYGVPGSIDRKFALKTAKALNFTPRLLEPERTTTIEEIKSMLKILEIPVHIPGGPLPQFRLLRAMKESGVETVISGQGGDELFSGYPWHFPLAMNRLRTKDPEKASRFESLHDQNPPFAPLDLRLCRRCFTRTSSWVNLNDGGACHALGLTRKEVISRRGVRAFAADLEEWHKLRRHSLMGRSLPFLLHYDYSLSSHFGLKGYTPFLNDDVVNLVSRFRLDFLYRDGLLKYPLRQIFPEVPESVRFLTKKRGFWHSSPDLPDLRGEVHRMLEDTELGDFVVHPEAIDTMKPATLWRFFSLGTSMEIKD